MPRVDGSPITFVSVPGRGEYDARMPYRNRVPISHTYCKVVTDHGMFERVAFHMPNDGSYARITQRADVLEERGPVENVSASASGEQVFTFGDGTNWRVTQMAKPCNCG